MENSHAHVEHQVSLVLAKSSQDHKSRLVHNCGEKWFNLIFIKNNQKTYCLIAKSKIQALHTVKMMVTHTVPLQNWEKLIFFLKKTKISKLTEYTSSVQPNTY
jgi:hypothetical protein